METIDCGLALDPQRFRSAGYIRREIYAAAILRLFRSATW